MVRQLSCNLLWFNCDCETPMSEDNKQTETKRKYSELVSF